MLDEKQLVDIERFAKQKRGDVKRDGVGGCTSCDADDVLIIIRDTFALLNEVRRLREENIMLRNRCHVSKPLRYAVFDEPELSGALRGEMGADELD